MGVRERMAKATNLFFNSRRMNNRNPLYVLLILIFSLSFFAFSQATAFAEDSQEDTSDDNSGSSDDDEDTTDDSNDDSEDSDDDSDDDEDVDDDSDDSDEDLDEDSGDDTDDSDDDSEEDDEDDSEDDMEDEDENDDDLEDEEDDMADAMDALADAEEEIDEATETITEKESEGYEVTAAWARLDEAKTLLAEAEVAFAAGEFDEAEDLAESAKYAAMYAKGKDIESSSEGAEIGEEFGECIADASSEDPEDLVESFSECFEELSDDVSDYIEKLLSEEDQMVNMALAEELQKLAAEVDGRLQELLMDFSNFTFSGVEEEEVISSVEEVLNADKSEEEKEEALEELIEKIKEESTENKFEDGLIPFKDTDDEEWYFNFVNESAAVGCVTGFKDEAGNPLGEFRPGNPILFGEGSKLVLGCILGEMPEESMGDEHWAHNYGVFMVEELADLLSPDLLEDFESALAEESQFNEEMTRGELIQLIVDVLGLEVPVATEAPFSDVPLTHPNVNAIQFALDHGVISGDSETGTFRPDEVANRAEIIKIIVLAKQLL